MASFKPSPQQTAILDWVDQSTGSLIVVARAGCGKTTTILQMVARAQGTAFIGAFNKSIALEIAGKLSQRGLRPPRINSSTWHSTGFGALRKVYPKLKIEGDKLGQLLTGLSESRSRIRSAIREYTGRKTVLFLVSFAKQHCFGVGAHEWSDSNAWTELAIRYGIDEDLRAKAGVAGNRQTPMVFGASIPKPGPKPQTQFQTQPNSGLPDPALEALVETAMELYQESVDVSDNMIDFDDMIFIPLLRDIPFPQYDWIYLDEAQDTAPGRRMMALRMLKPGGRLVAVGDDKQAINRFAGADSDALDLMRQATGAVDLPLTVTYRCPKLVVREANRLVPDLVAHESAPEGVVRSIPYKPEDPNQKGFWDEVHLKTDAVLCRNTRPLIDMLFEFLDRPGAPAVRFEGPSPAQAYLTLIDRMGPVRGIDVLSDRLSSYLQEYVQEWGDKRPEKAAAMTDKVETLLTICDRQLRADRNSVDQLRGVILNLFGSDRDQGENGGGDGNGNGNEGREQRLTLCTIHKSKGREWSRVYILGANVLIPSKWAKTQEDLDQENNLLYVAQTRAQYELVYVHAKRADLGMAPDQGGADEKAKSKRVTGAGRKTNRPQGPMDS